MKPSELFCFKDTINFAASLFFLAAGNKKFFSKFEFFAFDKFTLQNRANKSGGE